tara:strand:- start:1040 stop:1300 length:261 start_codon:yes stop_codon:yes gene_type:complete
MALSQKRAPNTEDANLNRIISKIYDDLNELINAVNEGQTSTGGNEYSGKVGDIKIFRKSDGTYVLRAKTEQGWASANLTLSTTEEI